LALFLNYKAQAFYTHEPRDLADFSLLIFVFCSQSREGAKKSNGSFFSWFLLLVSRLFLLSSRKEGKSRRSRPLCVSAPSREQKKESLPAMLRDRQQSREDAKKFNG
jgi:hypothetical protein